MSTNDTRQYIGVPTLHGLCKAPEGHPNHGVCKLYEEWNLKAGGTCSCQHCEHPKPNREKLLRRYDQRLDAINQSKVAFNSKKKQAQPRSLPNEQNEEEVGTMATKTKDSKSTKEPKVATEAGPRKERGALEAKVIEIVEAYEAGKFEVASGKTLTPHRIATEIAVRTKDEYQPSTGAVSAVLDRWVEYGYALAHPKPFAFKSISARGKKEGLDALKAKHRDKLKAERAAAKDAA